MRRLIFISLKALFGTALFAGLLLGLILFFIGTEGGRGWIAPALESFLRSKGVQEVRIGRITGDFPWAFGLDELFLRWEEGGVSARDIVVKWQPLELFSCRLHLDSIHVELIEILEGQGGGRGKSNPDPSIIIGALRRLELKHLKAESLRLPSTADRSEQSYSLEIQSSFHEGEKGQGRILLEATGTGGTEVKCAMSFSVNESILEIRAEARDPRQGPLTSLLGMGGAVNILLEGRGPLEEWEGSLRMEAEGMRGKNPVMASFSLNYDPVKRLLGIRRLLLGYDSTELTFSGEISLEDMRHRGTYSLKSQDGIALYEIPFKGTLEAEGQFSGRGLDARFNGVVRAREPSYRDLTARSAIMEFTFGLSAMVGSCKGTLSDLSSVSTKRIWSGFLRWNTERIAFLKEGILFGPLSLSGDPGMADLSGSYRSSDKTIRLNGRISLQDARKIPFPQAPQMPFSLEGDFRLDIDTARKEVRAEVEGMVERVKGGPLPPLLEGVLKDRTSLKAKVILEGGGGISIRDAEIITPSASLRVTASVQDGLIDCRWSISAKKTSDLIPIGVPFLEGGPLDAQGDISGRYPALSVNALLKTRDIRTEVGIIGSEGSVKGRIEASGLIEGKEILLRASLQADRRMITIKELLVELCGLTARGEIEFDTAARGAQGIIKGRANDISPLADLIPLKAKGPLSLDVVLQRSKGGQGIKADIRGESLILEGVSLEGVRLDVELEEAFSSPRLRGSALLGKAAYKGAEGRDIEMSFLWHEAEGSVTIHRGSAVFSHTEATLMNPLKLNLAEDSFRVERTSFEVNPPFEKDRDRALLRLDLTAIGESKTVRVNSCLHSKDRRLLEAELKIPLRFSLRPVSLSLSQDEMSGSLKGYVELADLRPVLEMWGQELAGKLSCSISVKGRPGSPVFDGDILLTEGRFAYPTDVHPKAKSTCSR